MLVGVRMAKYTRKNWHFIFNNDKRKASLGALFTCTEANGKNYRVDK